MKTFGYSSDFNSVSGLLNLGNTCFFNSVLQTFNAYNCLKKNLAQTPYIEQLLENDLKAANSQYVVKHDDDYDSELTDFDEEAEYKSMSLSKQRSKKQPANLTQVEYYLSDEEVNDSDESSDRNNNTNKFSKTKNETDQQKVVQHRSMRLNELVLSLKEPCGPLTRYFYDSIKTMKQSHTIFNPSTLFGALCKKVPSFKGFQQQDSHECLRNLLDAIKTEETKRRQAAILEHFNINNKSTGIDDFMKRKIKRYGRLSSHTLIDSVFGGHLLSSIVCEECKNCTQRVEPFLDLSLPINEDSLSASLAKSGREFINSLTDHKSKSKKVILKQERSKSSKSSRDYAKEDFKNAASDNDENLVDAKSKQLSKHQEKKLKKAAKKLKKKAKHSGDNRNNQEEKEECRIDDENEENIEKESANKQPTIENLTENLKKLDFNENSDEILNSQPPVKDKEILSAEEKEDEKEKREEGEEDEEEENDNFDYHFSKESVENKFNLEAQQSLSDERDFESGTLEFCLAKFTQKEMLGDRINCENCTRKLNKMSSKFSLSRCLTGLKNHDNVTVRKAYTSATKQYLICELPAVLTIHLKRFQQHGFRLEKSNKFIHFPLLLDIKPFTSKMCTNSNSNSAAFYSLFGLVEHSGRLNSGHYTACVKAMRRTSDDDLIKQALNRFMNKHRLCHLKKMFNQWSNKLKQQPRQESNVDMSASSKESAPIEPVDESGQKWFYISDSHVSEITVEKVLKSQAYLLFYQRIQ